VLVVACLNLAYFGLEFAVARMNGSVSLFANSADFLEDTLHEALNLSQNRFRLRARVRIIASGYT
jgi:Co/Zn/Cd efflux system component